MKKVFFCTACAVLSLGVLAGCSGQSQVNGSISETALETAIAPALQSAGYATYLGGQTYESGLTKNAEGIPLYTPAPLVDGYFATTEADFNLDGANEILVLATSSEQGNGENGFGTNTIKLLMLENEDKAWTVASEYKVDNVLLIDNGRFDVFYQTTGERATIFIENCFVSSSAADGLCYNLYPIAYVDGMLQQAGEILNFAGSAELDRYLGLNLDDKLTGDPEYDAQMAVTDYERDFVNAFASWGFNVREIGLDKPVMEADSNLHKVARIQSSLVGTDDEIINFYNNAEQSDLTTTKIELIDYTK